MSPTVESHYLSRFLSSPEGEDALFRCQKQEVDLEALVIGAFRAGRDSVSEERQIVLKEAIQWERTKIAASLVTFAETRSVDQAQLLLKVSRSILAGSE